MKMTQKLSGLMALVVLVSLSGCAMMSGQEEPQQDSAESSFGFGPDWWSEGAERDADYVYAYGFGESTNLRTARNLAQADGRVQLAGAIGTSAESVVEIGTEQALSTGEAQGVEREAMRTRAEQLLAGVGSAQSDLVRGDDGMFTAFVQMRMDREQYEGLVAQVAAEADDGLSAADAREVARGDEVVNELLER